MILVPAFAIYWEDLRTGRRQKADVFDSWLEARNFLANMLSRHADSVEINFAYVHMGRYWWIERNTENV